MRGRGRDWTAEERAAIESEVKDLKTEEQLIKGLYEIDMKLVKGVEHIRSDLQEGGPALASTHSNRRLYAQRQVLRERLKAIFIDEEKRFKKLLSSGLD